MTARALIKLAVACVATATFLATGAAWIDQQHQSPSPASHGAPPISAPTPPPMPTGGTR